MSCAPGRVSCLATAAGLLLATAAAGQASTAAAWQEHKGTIDYFGITSVYSCSGIEGKIRQLLLLLGARADASVNASSCGPGDMPMGHALTVYVRVFTLAPIDAPTDATPTPSKTAPLSARWSPVVIEDRRPMYMEAGDCELIDQMQEFIRKNFASRQLEYHAACTPHQLTQGSYALHGEFLQIAAQ